MNKREINKILTKLKKERIELNNKITEYEEKLLKTKALKEDIWDIEQLDDVMPDDNQIITKKDLEKTIEKIKKLINNPTLKKGTLFRDDGCGYWLSVPDKLEFDSIEKFL